MSFIYKFFCLPKTKIEPIEEKKEKNPKLLMLIVDDSIVFTKIVSKFADKLNIPHFTVINGSDALECMDYFVFDIIITDIDMPGMNGIKLISEIRKKSKVIPIIATSANPIYENPSLQVGADAFLKKPFKLEVFKETIFKLL